MKKSSSKVLLMKIAKHVFCATAVLAGLLLLGACSKSDADSDAGAKTQKYVIKLSATLDDGGNSSANGVSGATGAAGLLGGKEIDLESGLPTKVSLEDPGSGMKVYWSMTDHINVGYPYFLSGGTFERTSKTLTTTNNSGTSKSAKFQDEFSYSIGGNSPSGNAESEINAFYPSSLTLKDVRYRTDSQGIEEIDPYHSVATFDLASQIGFDPISGGDLYSKIIMGASHSLTMAGSSGTKDISVNLNFKHLTAILKINLTFNPAREFNGKVVISTVDSNNKLIVAGDTDAEGTILPGYTRGDVTINTMSLSAGTITSIPTVYVAVIGQTLNSELVITAGGLTATTTSVKGKTLEGGKVYTINKTLTAPGTPVTP